MASLPLIPDGAGNSRSGSIRCVLKLFWPAQGLPALTWHRRLVRLWVPLTSPGLEDTQQSAWEQAQCRKEMARAPLRLEISPSPLAPAPHPPRGSGELITIQHHLGVGMILKLPPTKPRLEFISQTERHLGPRPDTPAPIPAPPKHARVTPRHPAHRQVRAVKAFIKGTGHIFKLIKEKLERSVVHRSRYVSLENGNDFRPPLPYFVKPVFLLFSDL